MSARFSREQARMLLEPLLSLLEFRTESGDFPPKPARMIHFLEMRQLVKGDVIAHEGWGLHQAPVERDRAAARAGPPARPLVAYRHSLYQKPVQGGQLEHSSRQLSRRQPANMSLEQRAPIQARLGD